MITLKKENVVKRVDSEARALALEMNGFVRMDGKSTKAPDAGAGDLEAVKKELADAKEKLEAANKENAKLSQELVGTKEQLAAALKQNQKAAAKK